MVLWTTITYWPQDACRNAVSLECLHGFLSASQPQQALALADQQLGILRGQHACLAQRIDRVLPLCEGGMRQAEAGPGVRMGGAGGRGLLQHRDGFFEAAQTEQGDAEIAEHDQNSSLPLQWG